MKKVIVVFGTRPEAIKMAPLVLQLKKEKTIDVKVCVTAQHRQMLDQVLEEFQIKPDIDLNLMKINQSLTDVTIAILKGLENVFNELKPEYVFVHGDTATAMAATLAAFYQKIQVCHVEAGLRTGNIYSPWPEEGNRKLISSLAKFHFAPTKMAAENLARENVDRMSIVTTGNTVIDSMFIILDNLKKNKIKYETIKQKYHFLLKYDKLILVTCHRRENFGKGIEALCNALVYLSEKYPDCAFLYPVHMNQNISTPVHNIIKDRENIYLTKPLEYSEFLYLMECSYIILTDSGGIQEEAPSLNVPVLVLREETERPEAVDAGTVKIVGAEYENIVKYTEKLILNSNYYQSMKEAVNPYGDGTAALKIVNFIKKAK